MIVRFNFCSHFRVKKTASQVLSKDIKMSKKKMPRAVMTLKDFHGGSIPSDLPLPSAPGMTVDRSAYERQGSGAWSSPSLGRGYGSNDRGVGHFRQGSGNGARSFEDKASFFPNPANIGRNYEEDERKPVDGRPRSGHADRYEDLGYEDQRPHSSYEKTVDRFSVEEEGNYGPNARSYGRAAEAANYGQGDGQGDGQGYRQQSASAYVTEQVPPGSRNQSSYTQASQQNLLRAQPASPPSNWRQQLQQPVAAASAIRPAGPNVWPTRQDNINTRAVEPMQNDSRSAAPWRVPITPRADMVPVEKTPQGRWQPESDRHVPSHVAEVNPGRGSGFSDLTSRRPPAEPSVSVFGSERAHVVDTGRLGQGSYPESGRVGHGDAGRGAYLESGSGTYTDSGRRSYGDGYVDAGARGAYQDPNRGGYVDDGGRRRINEERSLGYDEPLRSGNSERITFSDSGRTVYPDSGRYGGESNRVVDYPENGRREFREQSRTDYVDNAREGEDTNRGGYTEASRGAYTERGRSGFASTRGNYGENLQASPLVAGGGRGAYNLEGARDSYGPASTRGSGYSAEGLGSYPRESGYGMDSTVAGPYGENQDRSRSPFVSNGSRSPPAVDGNRGGYSSSDSGPADPSRPGAAVVERPRLKLLPRSKPLDISTSVGAETALPEESSQDHVPEMEEKRPADVLTLDITKNEGHDEGDSTLGNSPSKEDLSRPAERPKLNLKPRSQPAESGVDLDSSGNVRQTVFGGARPRELVLKERGVDDPIILEAPPAPVAAISSKPERQEAGRTEVSHNNWGDEKQELAPRRYEPRGARSMEKQSSTFPESRQDGNRDPKDYRRAEDSRDRYESTRSYDRQDSRSRDVQEVARRDIDKQDSWRRPVSPLAPAPAPSPLLDSSHRQNSGRLGYTAPASAVELAQAFSRSTSLGGSPIIGGMNRSNSGNQRGPVSPGIRPGQSSYGSAGYHAASMNGGYPVKDAAPFSRLAEAPALPAAYNPSSGQGNDGYNGGSRVGFAGTGSIDSNWGPAYGRSDDDFPGKRGLPLRRPYE